jgi:hypothetical protein
MTAKLLSWSTFGLLIAGAFPFVSDTSVAPAASASLSRSTYSIAPILPACGACRIKADEDYHKIYAIDRNALCASAEPYRTVSRLSTKVYCENGTYWVCQDFSTMTCNVYIERPPCPNDNCKRTQ